MKSNTSSLRLAKDSTSLPRDGLFKQKKIKSKYLKLRSMDTDNYIQI